MTGVDEIGRILRSTPKSYDRILHFAALLAREIGSEVVVVGGSAIEVYTKGGYVSGDIDIRADREAVRRALAGWKFNEEGRLWIRADWNIAVDVVGNQYTGDPYRATTAATPYGPVQIAVVEDLFVKRLAAAKHWRVREALDEASLLWADYSDRMDVAYLDQQAATYKVLDLLAVFRKRAPLRERRRA
ncbi:MAG TPA: hypothetical protein VN864_02015 [Thermoplasmata archaeon]|nr:hypothetical protein [Thermoplasmata archaeon]